MATGYGERPPQFSPKLTGELDDVLYSLCLLASASGVDLEEAFTVALDKYERRWQRKGHPGSEAEA